jgi:hypothetical protein
MGVAYVVKNAGGAIVAPGFICTASQYARVMKPGEVLTEPVLVRVLAP